VCHELFFGVEICIFLVSLAVYFIFIEGPILSVTSVNRSSLMEMDGCCQVY
jgi:hypothetical protein